jgi:hypothetical protein
MDGKRNQWRLPELLRKAISKQVEQRKSHWLLAKKEKENI